LTELQSRIDINRRRAGALTFPLVALGFVNLAAAVWCMIAGRRHILVFYAPVLLMVIVASHHHERRMADHTGVQLPLRDWALAACTLAVASASVSRAGVALERPLLETAGPNLVWVLGYHLLGRWGRNRALVRATVAMVPAAAAATLILSGDALVAGQLTIDGLLLLAAALANTVPVL
jgi:hypothetical protein